MNVFRDKNRIMYEMLLDNNMSKNPDIIHFGVVNEQGCGKDLLLNADIFSMYFFEKSIFDDVIRFLLKKPQYQSKIDTIYANCKLNECYSTDYVKIDTLEDIRNAEHGLLYIHDAERYFNSRGLSFTKADPVLLDLVGDLRKNDLILRLSSHRYMSIDVKLRQLLQGWLFPDMYWDFSGNVNKMKSYFIKYDVFNGVGKKLMTNVLTDLWKFAPLYNTLEKGQYFNKISVHNNTVKGEYSPALAGNSPV